MTTQVQSDLILKIPFKKFKEDMPTKEHVLSEGERYNLAAQKIMRRKRNPYTHILIVYPRGGTVKYEVKT